MECLVEVVCDVQQRNITVDDRRVSSVESRETRDECRVSRDESRETRVERRESRDECRYTISISLHNVSSCIMALYRM